MDIKKLAPWNWFKKEEDVGTTVPVSRAAGAAYPEAAENHPILQLQREMDRLFENTFRNFGFSGLLPARSGLTDTTAFLRPQVDIGASDQEYTITVEVPGVSEKDIRIEIADNTMTIRGEKKREKEEKERDYYRIERAYGSFQRVLNLPEDADQQSVSAHFSKGVLTIAMKRVEVPASKVKQVEITEGER